MGHEMVSDDAVGERADSWIRSHDGCVFLFFFFLLPWVKPEYL